MKGKRTHYEIYWEILTYCRLNSKIGQEHIGFLEDKGYLRRFEEAGQNLLKTTDDAKLFLGAFKEMYLELFNRRPDFKL